ncbi:hypothetical protein GB927_025710 [Shinella sp. CPCC 100929]|uniref:Uncharacterized protein n=1 Tax=Shinella lacus TaxID=2654216 RepID=A0ABT1RE86_9HYPH|nr:hypothetical protein [Shinella lacus]MCQ4633462.1 hypothetical protein [Shinella lacus]
MAAMHKQLKVLGLAGLLLIGGVSFAVAEGENPYAEPSPEYLRQFAAQGAKAFVLERYDAEGKLAARSVEKLEGQVEIDGPVHRTIAGRKIALRGLTACPSETVVYNRVQTWSCTEAARDYTEAVYNRRASVILCKTLLLAPADGQTTPASCFVLVGGNGEPFKTVNDDDSMVFLGLAAIGRTLDGRSRRPDLEASQSLSRSMGFQNAD